jgi:AcrR family transcriptional regulator
MATPSKREFTAKGAATRERILEAAANVLLNDGMAGFSVDRVRLEASASGSQMAHYFDDRDDLIRAVVERQIEKVLTFHRQPKVGGLDTFEDWQQWAELNVQYLKRTGFRGTSTYHALAGQLAKYDEATRQTFADGYWRWVHLLEDSFARMKARGVLVDSADPRQLALMVVSCHQGAGLLTYAYRQSWPLVEITGFVVGYLRSLAADPAERTQAPRRRPRRRYRLSATAGYDEPTRFTPKGLSTRARIVDGAARLMFEQGVNGTSLDDVRAALGVSGSQISHYFADKQDLTRRVINARADNVIAFHRQPKLARLDSLEALRAWADACWTLGIPNYLRGGCIYGSLTGELLEAGDLVLDALADGYDRWLEVFEGGLSAMQDRGELAPEAQPAHLATGLLGAHQGSALLTFVTGSPEPFRAAVDGAIAYVETFASPGAPSKPKRVTRSSTATKPSRSSRAS